MILSLHADDSRSLGSDFGLVCCQAPQKSGTHRTGRARSTAAQLGVTVSCGDVDEDTCCGGTALEILSSLL